MLILCEVNVQEFGLLMSSLHEFYAQHGIRHTLNSPRHPDLSAKLCALHLRDISNYNFLPHGLKRIKKN